MQVNLYQRLQCQMLSSRVRAARERDEEGADGSRQRHGVANSAVTG